MNDINIAMEKLELHEKMVKQSIIEKIAESAQKVCKKYSKVIQGFEMGHNQCYFIFMGEPINSDDDYNTKGANDVLNENDWDLIELYGIETNKDFKKLYELLILYDERFYLTDTIIEILKDNEYKIEVHTN